jgi:ferredoxin-NADP reductase
MLFESIIEKIIPRTSSVKSFQIPRPLDFYFKAGQFVEVTIKVDGQDQTKYFTISSSPTETQYIQFTKRITDSAFSKTLDQLEPGAWIRINGPMGRFTLDRASGKIAFLSGGIGITPIRSICRYAVDKKIDTDIVLIYGNRNEHDIPFKDDLKQMQQKAQHLKIVHVLDKPGEGWNGYRGFITKEIIAKEAPDYADRVFFVCGPPKMVEGMVGMLKNDLFLTDERIVIENFSGY